MKGITFGALHSYNDLNLILSSKEIGSPEVKERKIEIEGSDSAIDLTDFFGEPKYEDVTHKFHFSAIGTQAQLLSLFSTVKNALHGKKMRIILDDDPLFFYMGRIKVLPFTNEKNIGKITIEADCEPYKYKMEKTVASFTIGGTQEINLTNGRKRAVPEVLIETESGIRIEYMGSNVWDLGSGTYTLPELELFHGANNITITGTGTITFTYQEADL